MMISVKDLKDILEERKQHKHYEELLSNVVEHVAVAENISTQIKTLQNDFGFTRKDLIDFGYNEDDIDSALSEDDEDED